MRTLEVVGGGFGQREQQVWLPRGKGTIGGSEKKSITIERDEAEEENGTRTGRPLQGAIKTWGFIQRAVAAPEDTWFNFCFCIICL